MDTVQIEKDIRKFVADKFLFGRSQELTDQFPLLGNVIDSTGALELLAFLQERFGITWEDEDMAPENFDSVPRMAQFIARKLNGKG